MNTKAKLASELDDFYRASLKPGDLISVGNGPLVVKKVNRKTVTSSSGTTWRFDEFTFWNKAESREMTTAEMVEAFKAWRAR